MIILVLSFFTNIITFSYIVYINESQNEYFFDPDWDYKDSIIRGFNDAIWLNFVAITTIGYGDILPRSV